MGPIASTPTAKPNCASKLIRTNRDKGERRYEDRRDRHPEERRERRHDGRGREEYRRPEGYKRSYHDEDEPRRRKNSDDDQVRQYRDHPTYYPSHHQQFLPYPLPFGKMVSPHDPVLAPQYPPGMYYPVQGTHYLPDKQDDNNITNTLPSNQSKPSRSN